MNPSMYSYQSLQEKVENKLQSISLPDEPEALYEPIRYVLNLGGKRIRPVITLMSCDLFQGSIEETLDPAVGLEIFHNFTLVHDDIMDNAAIRRGNPTVHEKWNRNNAILSGDLIQVMANQAMIAVGDDILREVLAMYNDTATKVCEGQQMDMDFEERDDVSHDEYLTMISLKTANLLASSLKLGAITGRTDASNKDNIAQFGLNLGIAFQIQDDLLDTYGQSNQFGKQIGGDIKAGKKTFLLLKALEWSSSEQAGHLLALIKNREMDSENKIREVTKIFDELGIPEATREERDAYYAKAVQHLEAISAPSERKAGLKKLADYLMQREQ